MITPQPMPLDPAKAPKLLDQVRDKIRLKHYSIRTEQTYVDWIKRFVLFNRPSWAEYGAGRDMYLPSVWTLPAGDADFL